MIPHVELILELLCSFIPCLSASEILESPFQFICTSSTKRPMHSMAFTSLVFTLQWEILFDVDVKTIVRQEIGGKESLNEQRNKRRYAGSVTRRKGGSSDGKRKDGRMDGWKE